MNSHDSSTFLELEPLSLIRKQLTRGLVLIAFLSLFLLFVGVLTVLFLSRGTESVDSVSSENRVHVVNQMNQQDQKNLENYQIINLDQNQVRLPIDQAIEKTLEQYTSSGPLAQVNE